jgi:hypothetical protein
MHANVACMYLSHLVSAPLGPHTAETRPGTPPPGGMNPAENAATGIASYSRGDKLRLCAPAHSGLPLNAVAIVAASRPSPDGFRYDLTLTGGGASGSDVQFVKEFPEEWLRSESRIATAKACAHRPWGLWLRSTPRLLVPLFQRRYCWSATQQQRLWRDVAAPPGLAPHGLGRVVVQRSRLKPADSIVVDGQQRTSTLMLLLAAVRDVALALDAERAAPLVRLVTGALLRPKTAPPSLDAADGEALRYAYSAGLEGLAGAEWVRLVPSREDRRAYAYYSCTCYGCTCYACTYYGHTYTMAISTMATFLWLHLLGAPSAALCSASLSTQPTRPQARRCDSRRATTCSDRRRDSSRGGQRRAVKAVKAKAKAVKAKAKAKAAVRHRRRRRRRRWARLSAWHVTRWSGCASSSSSWRTACSRRTCTRALRRGTR